ncbi:hypothetical protein [Gloeocapsa sp. PCC 73106]|nr:hypothetical protein [Gloeocapsa sp. PCC 73106]ELR97987.1 hypothetical protein GLO73106DRAFT_00018060 [Gloeocapsa sp. PCC 73106]
MLRKEDKKSPQSASSEEKYQIWIALAAGKLSEEELAEWIREHFSPSFV